MSRIHKLLDWYPWRNGDALGKLIF